MLEANFGDDPLTISSYDLKTISTTRNGVMKNKNISSR